MDKIFVRLDNLNAFNGTRKEKLRGVRDEEKTSVTRLFERFSVPERRCHRADSSAEVKRLVQ